MTTLNLDFNTNKDKNKTENTFPARRNAIRRLMADLEDWNRHLHEFPCINALPLENNIFEWHCNLAANGGKFAGIVIHLILTFPTDYPSNPPKVKVCTPIPHPNVFSDWICLDMIRTDDQGKYKGWTPAYSALSLLMQLQSFLFEESGIDQDYGGSYKNYINDRGLYSSILKISQFSCNKCGHCWNWVYPPVKWHDRKLLINNIKIASNQVTTVGNALKMTNFELNAGNELQLVSIAKNDKSESKESKEDNKTEEKCQDTDNTNNKSKNSAKNTANNSKKTKNGKIGIKQQKNKKGYKDNQTDKLFNMSNTNGFNRKNKSKKQIKPTPKKVLTMKEYNARLKDINNNNNNNKQQNKQKKKRNKKVNRITEQQVLDTGFIYDPQVSIQQIEEILAQQTTLVDAIGTIEALSNHSNNTINGIIAKNDKNVKNVNNIKQKKNKNAKAIKKNEDKKDEENKCDEKKELEDDIFRFWDGIYYDIEFTILKFFGDIRDLYRMKRVNKHFLRMIENCPQFLRHGIQCWFHRSSKLSKRFSDSKDVYHTIDVFSKQEDDDMVPLCLGYGITPNFFSNNNFIPSKFNNNNSNNNYTNNNNNTTLADQLFGSPDESHQRYLDSVRRQIGNYEMISHIDTTFDLLSTDAFENFNIRKTVFKDREFTHLMPLYLGYSHGKLSMKILDKYILSIYNQGVDPQCWCDKYRHARLTTRDHDKKRYSNDYIQLTPKAKDVCSEIFGKYATGNAGNDIIDTFINSFIPHPNDKNNNNKKEVNGIKIVNSNDMMTRIAYKNEEIEYILGENYNKIYKKDIEEAKNVVVMTYKDLQNIFMTICGMYQSDIDIFANGGRRYSISSWNFKYELYNGQHVLTLNEFLRCFKHLDHNKSWQLLHGLGYGEDLKSQDDIEDEKKQDIEKINKGYSIKKYHPFLSIYIIANIMKSLIVSVMQKSNNDQGAISLHYSINILEAFFRYHHLLLAIYYLNKKKIKPIVQDQIRLFFNNILDDEDEDKENDRDGIDNGNRNGYRNGYNNGRNMNRRYGQRRPRKVNYRNKTNIPDYGVFLMYLTLWEHDNGKEGGLSWNQVGSELLDETLTRQVKWVLNKHTDLINNRNETKSDRHKRIEQTWAETLVSRRLFMFQYFFLKQVCQLFPNNKNKDNKSKKNNNKNGKGKGKNKVEKGEDGTERKVIMTPKLKYFEYNRNFGSSKDKSLPEKLQLFVKKIYKCNNYEEFFNIIEIKYPGSDNLSNWLFKCLQQSGDRMYHKPYVYYSKLKKEREEAEKKAKEEAEKKGKLLQEQKRKIANKKQRERKKRNKKANE